MLCLFSTFVTAMAFAHTVTVLLVQCAVLSVVCQHVVVYNSVLGRNSDEKNTVCFKCFCLRIVEPTPVSKDLSSGCFSKGMTSDRWVPRKSKE